MTTTTMIENRWYGVVGQFTRGIAHTAASYYYGVNGPQAAHTWEPAGSKPSSLIGRDKALSFPSSEGAFRAHAIQARLLDCKTSLTFLQIPPKP